MVLHAHASAGKGAGPPLCPRACGRGGRTGFNVAVSGVRVLRESSALDLGRAAGRRLENRAEGRAFGAEQDACRVGRAERRDGEAGEVGERREDVDKLGKGL